jgi:catechol 2,3-dioxygenase
MSDLFLKHVVLAIPNADIESASIFYQAFGLNVRQGTGPMIDIYCDNIDYPSVRLVTGTEHKKLHHIQMGATATTLKKIKTKAQSQQVRLEQAPQGFEDEGLWIKDPNGILYHIIEAKDDYKVSPVPAFTINSPGNDNRLNKGALDPKSALPAVRPRRLGHALIFTPDVDSSLNFVEQIFDMRLSDRSGEVVAFTHCEGGSEHHVLAFAKSEGIGFHHASFLVATPDEVGIGGDRMFQKGYTKAWGFGRHSIGSNFFHYVADPWGSYLEYYCDMDYISDSDSWESKDWPAEDALHSWGPLPPQDFVHNYEVEIFNN